MTKNARYWFIFIVALLVAIPAVTHGEPIRLTSGFLFVDHTDFDFAYSMRQGRERR